MSCEGKEVPLHGLMRYGLSTVVRDDFGFSPGTGPLAAFGLLRII